MGSIQGLRSEALALRAKEDTNLQIAGHLGGVNKALGSQIVGMIDQLQGIIGERTKAYNASMIKLTQTINGKNGIGEKGMNVVFKTIGLALTVAGEISNPSATHLLAAGVDCVAIVADTIGLRATVNSAVFDYEKASSQLGYINIVRSVDSSVSLPSNTGDPGVVKLYMPETP